MSFRRNVRAHKPPFSVRSAGKRRSHAAESCGGRRVSAASACPLCRCSPSTHRAGDELGRARSRVTAERAGKSERGAVCSSTDRPTGPGTACVCVSLHQPPRLTHTDSASPCWPLHALQTPPPLYFDSLCLRLKDKFLCKCSFILHFKVLQRDSYIKYAEEVCSNT